MVTPHGFAACFVTFPLYRLIQELDNRVNTCKSHLLGAVGEKCQYTDGVTMLFQCIPCDRTFNSNTSLKQHKRTSPDHVFNCVSCNRRFSSEEALQQHLDYSPVHAPSFNCEDCNQSFSSEDALLQHLRDSPVHAPPTFDCNDCDRSFNSQDALTQHLRDSPNHQPDMETPLDAFFRSFSTFQYDPSLPPATSYAKLERHQGWHRDNHAPRTVWHNYQDALESELKMWYGAENDLTAWHVLCRAIGVVKPLPKTCEKCVQVSDCMTQIARRELMQTTGRTKDTCQYC